MRDQKNKIILTAFIALFCCQTAWSAKFDKKEEDAYYVAVKAFEDGFYDVSLNLFDRFLKTYIDSDTAVEAMIYVGQCYFFQEKYIKALNQFESLLKLDRARSSRDKVLFWLGEVYSKGRDYRQAAVFYRELINNYKDSFYLLSGYKSLASAQFNEGRLDEALVTYRAMPGLFKDDQTREYAFFGICEVLYRMKDYVLLKKELINFIELFPRSRMIHRVYFYLGEANFYLGVYQDAVEDYKKVLVGGVSDDEVSLANLGMGWTYLKLKKFDEAKKVFSEFDENNESPSVLLGRAVLEAGLGSFNRAIGLFDRVILNDKSGEYTTFAYFAKAEVYYHLGNFDDAIISYRTSLDKLKIASGVYTDVQELRDKIYYGLAWSYLKVGDFVSAQQAFQKVASLSTDKIVKLSALIQLADTYQDAGDYKKAIEAYQSFVLEYPDTVYNDYIQYQLGMTWLKMDDFDSAVLAFRKLLKDYPSSQMLDDACYYLGLAYFRKSDYQGARLQLEKFHLEFKDSAYRTQALFVLGESLSSLGEFKPAIENFNTVCKEAAVQDTLCQKAEYEAASVFARMGNEAEANKRLADFIAKYPDSQLSPDILFWLGQSYSAKKNFALSRKYFERLIRNYPEHELLADAYLEVGMTNLAEQNLDAALRNFTQGRQKGKDASLARAGILLGDLHFAASDFDSALKDYGGVIDMGQTSAKTAYVKIAGVYRRLKNYNEALNALEKSLSLEGSQSNAEIQFGIAELLEELNRKKDAREAYLKVYYLYPEDKVWAVKALLRVARIYEDEQDEKNFISCLEKISKFGVPEAKYAKDRLLSLKKGRGNI